MKRKISLVVISLGFIVSVSGLFIMLNLTSPFKSGSLGILIVFGLIYLLTLSVLLILERLAGVIYRLMRPSRKKPLNENTTKLLNRRVNLIVMAVSFVPIFVISMNSIGQLNLIDIALIIIIEAVLIFYILRRTAN